MSVPLVRCPACDRLVSSRASSCIYCGDPLTPVSQTPERHLVHPPSPATIAPGWVRDTIYRVTIEQMVIAGLLAWYSAFVLWNALTDYTGIGSVLWIVAAIAGLYFTVRWFVRSLRILMEPARHPRIIRSAASLPRSSVIESLDSELSAPDHTTRGVRVTRQWILFPSWIRFAPIHATDVIWAHAKITTTRLYGVIPMGRTHSVQVYDRFGEIHTRNAPERDVEILLRRIQELAPWALFGYHDDRRRQFSNAKTRANLIEEIDRRQKASANNRR